MALRWLGSVRRQRPPALLRAPPPHRTLAPGRSRSPAVCAPTDCRTCPIPTEQRGVRQVEAAANGVQHVAASCGPGRPVQAPCSRQRARSPTSQTITSNNSRTTSTRSRACARMAFTNFPDPTFSGGHVTFDSAARRRHQLNAVHAGPAHLPAAHPRGPPVQRVRRMTHIKVLAVGGLVLLLAACSGGSSGSHVAQLPSAASPSSALVERRDIADAPGRSGRLRPMHAGPRRTEVARSRQQRCLRQDEDHHATTRGQ